MTVPIIWLNLAILRRTCHLPAVESSCLQLSKAARRATAPLMALPQLQRPRHTSAACTIWGRGGGGTGREHLGHKRTKGIAIPVSENSSNVHP